MSGAIFILRWSCFRTRFNDRAISIFLVEEVMKSDECCRWWSGTGSMKFLHRFVNIDTWIYLSFYKYLSKLMFVWCDDVRTVVDDEVELGVWSFPTLAIKSLVHFHPPSPPDDSYLSLKRPQKVWLRHSNLVIHFPPKVIWRVMLQDKISNYFVIFCEIPKNQALQVWLWILPPPRRRAPRPTSILFQSFYLSHVHRIYRNKQNMSHSQMLGKV